MEMQLLALSCFHLPSTTCLHHSDIAAAALPGGPTSHQFWGSPCCFSHIKLPVCACKIDVNFWLALSHTETAIRITIKFYFCTPTWHHLPLLFICFTVVNATYLRFQRVHHLCICIFTSIAHLFSNFQVQLQHTSVLQLGGGIVRRLRPSACSPGLYYAHADLDPILAGPAFGSL